MFVKSLIDCIHTFNRVLTSGSAGKKKSRQDAKDAKDGKDAKEPRPTEAAFHVHIASDREANGQILSFAQKSRNAQMI